MCGGLKRFIHAIALVGKPGVMEFFLTSRSFVKALLRQIWEVLFDLSLHSGAVGLDT